MTLKGASSRVWRLARFILGTRTFGSPSVVASFVSRAHSGFHPLPPRQRRRPTLPVPSKRRQIGLLSTFKARQIILRRLDLTQRQSLCAQVDSRKRDDGRPRTTIRSLHSVGQRPRWQQRRTKCWQSEDSGASGGKSPSFQLFRFSATTPVPRARLLPAKAA